jgi:high-affinity Fe2+/Pb2+ permease
MSVQFRRRGKTRALVIEVGSVRISIDSRELMLLLLACFVACGLSIGALEWSEVLDALRACLPWHRSGS